MKNSILIVCLGLVLMSCGKSNKRDYRFADNGLIYNSHNNELYTGRVTDTADVVVQYDVINGKKNGEFVTYYLNGRVEKTGWMKLNRNVGEWKYFYPEGSLESKGHFINDLPSGEWEFYYKNGNTKHRGSFQEGFKNGDWFHYDIEGNLIEHTFYHNGEIKDSPVIAA